MKISSLFLRSALLALPLVLIACGGDDDDDPAPVPTPEMSPSPTPVAMVEYEVTIVNLTNNQPLSPIAAIVHDANYTPWSIGQAASAGLEELAESGSPANFIAEASSLATEAGTDPVGPGGSETLSISLEEQSGLYITVASMLVNTNDAFAGISSMDLSDLAVGEYLSAYAPVYDAGTESNTELAGTIPGPADGGEGSSDGREDNDIVTRHPGVVTSSDGYTESVLDESHRFDNMAMKITIERVM